MHIHAKMQQKLQEDYQKEARRMQHEARIAPSLGIEYAKSDYDKTSAGLASFLKAKGVSNYAFQSAWSTAQFYKANEHQNPLMDETSSSEWMDFLAKHHGGKMEKADYEALKGSVPQPPSPTMKPTYRERQRKTTPNPS